MKSFDEAVCARVVSSRFNVPDTQKLRELSEKRGLKLWSPICSENLGYGKVLIQLARIALEIVVAEMSLIGTATGHLEKTVYDC